MLATLRGAPPRRLSLLVSLTQACSFVTTGARPCPAVSGVDELTSDPAQQARLQAALQRPVKSSADGATQSEREKELELFRLHNSSLKLRGRIVEARVLDVDKKRVVLDTGLKIAKIGLSDITPESILATADGAPRESDQVRPGDTVQVYLQYEETPEGDMFVSGQQAALERRSRAVWKELDACQKAGAAIKGRVLNALHGGYAVGVAGLVCFLPANRCSKSTAQRIGELQDFKIVNMNVDKFNVVLADANYDADFERQFPMGPRQHLGRPQREVKRLAQELEEALEDTPAKQQQQQVGQPAAEQQQRPPPAGA